MMIRNHNVFTRNMGLSLMYYVKSRVNSRLAMLRHHRQESFKLATASTSQADHMSPLSETSLQTICTRDTDEWR